uniref:Tetratricopeptide repeat protein 40 n=1 Tax=Phallusia mammillata TaxID=59560 RepID=A0A6F9D9C1_9ASCI|nr:tetratricopeptide repeat protein 40 [Phallusia mammillata]
MDAGIRQLIQIASVNDEASGAKLAVEAYNQLQQAFLKSKETDAIDTVGSDLYVQCAEICFKLKQNKISQDCLHMYFNGTPLANQFLCRAYLCQAQLLSPKSAEEAVEFETSVVYLLKAITFAKTKPRYHFIVYNASVLYWQMARPFLRPRYCKLLHQSLQQVVKALEDINDPDHEWRATLMVALIESFVDANCIKEASQASQAAAQFTITKSKAIFKNVFQLQIKHKLVDLNKLAREIKNMPEYSAFFRLQKIKASVNDKPVSEVVKELNKLSSALTGKSLPGTKTSTSESRKRSMPDDAMSINSEDSQGSRASNMSSRRGPRHSVVYHADVVSIHEESQSELEMLLRPYLLIEVSRLCIEMNQVIGGKQCLNELKDCNISDPSLVIEMEFLECELMVKELGDDQEKYTKHSVEVRVAAIKRMEQALQNAIRSGKANVVQGACATQWNLCLPLLQKNLRKLVRRPLTAVAEALEDISSMQVTLRCQVHTELAKCEEAVEQVEAAVKHVNKALQLDDTGFYHERLHTMLHRLQLSTQLYRTPDRSEDVAAIIIEQARKSSESGSVRMKRSLLVKAGLALAPDAFQYVLDSENEMKATGGVKGLVSEVQVLGARASQWKKSVRKAPGHLKRLGDDNDRERVRLWVDLVKTARQQQVWDVCRVAAIFCLLYDDGRWKVKPKDGTDSSREKRTSDSHVRAPGTADSSSVGQKTPVPDSDSGAEATIHDSDLLRMLAEVYFVKGEAFIHLLQCEGLKLNESPTAPVDTRQRPKGHEYKKPEEEPAWAEYTDWIHDINHQATNAFLRAVELGIELEETWLICSGSAYIWNYNNHLLVAHKYTELVQTFDKLLFGMQEIGHSSEATLLIRICDVIAKGLITPWIPKKLPIENQPVAQTAATTATKDTTRKKTGGKGTGTNATPGTANALAVDPEGMDDLKKALEVCEYGLNITNGSKAADVVSTAIRHQLLSTWVKVKQLLQQQIAPGFGVENEKLADQRDMTKSLITLEMIALNKNGMVEFTVPEISEVCDVVDDCRWDDAGVELEVWSRLAQLSRIQKSHSLVVRCTTKALSLESSAVKKKSKNSAKSAEKHKQTVALEMLAYASCILGESLMDTCAANPPARRQAMRSFVSSTQFAERAGNFTLVMASSRRWWNAALPLIPSPLERELLRQPLEVLLQSIFHTAASVQYSDETEEVSIGKGVVKVVEGESQDTSSAKQSVGVSLGDPSDDRTLRAAMYGVLFQTYADKGEWEEGLVVMDRALHHMPRTKHRLLLFKHRVIVKAKLGKNVQMDIAKFRDESEDYVSHMWHRVALCSCNTLEQLMAFQKSIEALHSEETQWQKFEYLIELSTWMYSNEFRNEDSINVIEWACDILTSMKFHVEVVEEKQVEKGKGKKAKGGKPASRAQAASRVESKPSVPKQEKSQPNTRQKSDEKSKEEEAQQHVPVEREIVIGVPPADHDIVKFEHLRSTRQLEGLIRGHVMMATISGIGSNDHQKFCMLAYGYVMRLWKIALTSAGSVMKNLPKSDTNIDDGRKTSAKKKTPAAPPAKEKAKRKGAPEAIPITTSDWATYEPSEEIKQAFLYDTSDCGINKQTITCAGMTVFHLLKLSDYLRDCALNQLALPVLALAGVITNIILQSTSWTQLINIRQIIVCYELHLFTAAEQWINSIESFLTESEQTSSKQDLELKKIHKELAKLEEERIRKARGDGENQDNKVSSAKTTSTASNKDLGPITLTGRKVGGVNLSEIWTEKAKMLIGLGHYQVSRTLLNEALTIANYNNDEVLKADIYHGLAKLAVHEGNNGQALQYLRNAQSIGGDENFWMENICLLTDAIELNQDQSPEDVQKIAKIAKISVECISSLADMRPTKSSTTGFMKAMLNARALLLRLKNQTRQVSGLLKKLEQMEEILQSLGFHRKLAMIHMEHAEVLVRLSKTNQYLQHVYLLKAIEILNSSVNNLTNMCISILPMETDKQVSLPVHRELTNLQLHLVETLLEAFQLSSGEERVAKAKEAEKDALQRIVEDYVGEINNDQDQTERSWNSAKSTFILKAFGLLNLLHSSLPSNHIMRCRWLYLFGHGLRLLGESGQPDHPENEWNIDQLGIKQVIEQLQSQTSIENVSSNVDINETPQDDYFTSRQQQKMTEDINGVMHQSVFTTRMLGHATEVLSQCINMSLPLQATEVISKASLDIVECCAQCDPSLAALHLALHQSAETSISMRNLVMKTLSDPTASQLSSLLHQEAWLMKNSVSTGLEESSLRKNIQNTLLNNFMAWKRLQLSQNHLDLLKDFPSTYNIVIMQHSPDQSALYCAMLDKPKPSGAAGDGKSKGKEKQAQAPDDSRAFVVKLQVNSARFEELIEKHGDYQQRLMSFLLQSEYQRTQLAMRQKMLQQLSKGAAEVTISETALEEQAMEEMKIQEEFSEILSGMESYLEGITSELKSKLINAVDGQAQQLLQSGQSLSDLPQELVILLAGPHLMQLPLEALETLQTPHIDAISRDFSLQLLHRRWFVDPEEAALAADKKKNDAKIPPKTPKAGKDTGKKASTPAAKMVPLNRELPPGCLSIDTHSVHYIIDPHTDCSETEQYRPAQIFKQLMQLYGQSFTPRWSGIFGPESFPSVGQWETMLNDCSAFIFYGMERFIAQFPPSKLVALNLDDCQLALLIDKSQTNKSFRNQSKVDVDKTNTLLSIEKPIQTAMLLSLCGANCVCLNQWHTTSEDNAVKLQGLMSSILEDGVMVGQAARKILNPTLKKPEPSAQETPVTPMGKEAKAKQKAAVKDMPSRNQSVNTVATPLVETPLPEDTDMEEIVTKLDASWCNMVVFGLPNLVVT